MKVLKMCLNWKVLAGLGAVGIGIYLISPNLMAAVLPILLLAVCPLSMLLMMKVMHESQDETRREPVSQEIEDGPTPGEPMGLPQKQRADSRPTESQRLGADTPSGTR